MTKGLVHVLWRALALVVVAGALLASPTVRAQGEAGTTTARPRVERVQFRGNRKVEDDAIKVNLKTAPGVSLTQEILREDVHAIWKMGYFEDVQVEVNDTKAGAVVVFVLREKPAIAKIYVAGSEEIQLSKINEVLDIKKDTIVDPAKVKRNVEKIKDLYVEKGYYLAEVGSDIQRKDENHVDIYFKAQ